MKCKFIVVFLLLLTFIFIPFQTALAAPYSSSFQTPNVEDNVPQDLGTYSQSVVIELATAAVCQIYGVNPVKEGAKCLGVNPETGKIGFVEDGGGLVGVMGNMIASLFYIPIQPNEPFQYWANGFIGNKKTQAAQATDEGGDGSRNGQFCMADQANSCCNGNANCSYVCEPVDPVGGGGICKAIGNGNTSVNNDSRTAPENKGGFAGLKPFAGIWLKFTQIVFLFYVAIFMLVGFGIMLRLPIDSRAVMSIQNQLPKIIISIILILFSFAIVGFLIDFMYLIIFLLFGLVNSVGGGSVVDMNPAQLQGTNPFGLVNGLGGIGGISAGGASAVGGFITPLFDNGFGRVIAAILGALIGGGAGLVGGIGGAAVGGVIGMVIGGVASSNFLGFLGSLIAFLIIGFAIISALFRLWWKLLQAYVLLLFNVILAPFWIMGGVLPGVKFGFGSWLKSCIGHLSVFPTTIMMFLVGKVIMDAVKGSGDGFFVPPLIGASIGADDIATIIGLGVILATPSIVDNVQKAIGASGVGAQSIGQSIGFGQSMASSLRKQAVGAVWKKDQFGNPKGVLNYKMSKTLDNWNKKGGTGGAIAKTVRFFRPYDKNTGKPYADNPTQSSGVQRELERVRGTQPQGIAGRLLRRKPTAPQPLPGGRADLTNRIDTLTQDFAGDKEMDKVMKEQLKTMRLRGNNLTQPEMDDINQKIEDQLMKKTNQQLDFMRNRDPRLAQSFETTRDREQGNHDNLRKLALLGQQYVSNPRDPKVQDSLTEEIAESEKRLATQQQQQQQQAQQQQTAQVTAQNQALKQEISTMHGDVNTLATTHNANPQDIKDILENLDQAYEDAEGDQAKLQAIRDHIRKLNDERFSSTAMTDINNQLKAPLQRNLTLNLDKMRQNRIDQDVINNFEQSRRREEELNPNNFRGLSLLNQYGEKLSQDPDDQVARNRINEFASHVNADYNRKIYDPEVTNLKNTLTTTMGHLSSPTPSHLPTDPELNTLIQNLETRVNNTNNPFPIEKVRQVQRLIHQLNDTTNPVNAAQIGQIKNDIRGSLT